MQRRAFIQHSGTLMSISMLPISGMHLLGCTNSLERKIPTMDLHWQNWKTKRPFAPDVDDSGMLWHGHDTLFCSDLDKNSTKNIGIDGITHHFLNIYLVFDPEQNKFGYLVPESKGRYPLLCYSLVHKDKLIITGFDIWNPEEKIPVMAKEGELLIFHN